MKALSQDKTVYDSNEGRSIIVRRTNNHAQTFLTDRGKKMHRNGIFGGMWQLW
jgi:hypothetical protein